MLGIIIYEFADVIYHIGKIGYNCVNAGISVFYKKDYSAIIKVDKVDLYRRRLEELEERLKSLEKNN